MTIGDRVRFAREQVAEAAISVGRDPLEISLVAATKTNPYAAVREAILAGVSACGENRAQEMLAKLAEGAFEGVPLHFIGRLQKNKVNKVAGCCALIQSVDSSELVSLISARAQSLGIVQDILIEVNIGGEEAKSGVLPAELPRLLDFSEGFAGICVRGLMTIPPITANLRESRKYFDAMYKLYVDITAKKYDNRRVDILSMGMSGDYTEAVRAGSTMVRLGQALFGPRVY